MKGLPAKPHYGFIIILLSLSGPWTAYSQEFEAHVFADTESPVIRELLVKPGPYVIIKSKDTQGNEKSYFYLSGSFLKANWGLIAGKATIKLGSEGKFRIKIPLDPKYQTLSFNAIGPYGDIESQRFTVRIETRPSFFEKQWRKIQVDAFGSIGDSKVNTTLDSSPTLLNFTLGLGAYYPVWKIVFLGLCSDFQLINQYSKVNKAGSYKGTRWNMISPVIGANYKDFTLKADFSFLGNFNPSNQTDGEQDVTYSDPFGFRIQVSYNFYDQFLAGLQYQSLSFGKVEVIDFEERSLDPSLHFWQIGIVLTYRIKRGMDFK